MNRNVESHFSELPKIDIERSIFDRSSSHKTSFNTGELIPFYVDEVLPGDTFNVTTSCVVRLQTPLTPIMDNIYLDTYYFFVPNRLVWEHWKEFMGENTASAWIPSTSYTIPKIAAPTGGWNSGTIADYLGMPVGVDAPNFFLNPLHSPSQLPFRGYALICNEWFRDQNLTDPLNIPVNDSNITGSNGTNYITDTVKGGAPFKVAKYHDYFTSCLPYPQKNANIGLWANNLNSGITPNAYDSYVPVITRSTEIPWNSSNFETLRLTQKTWSTAGYGRYKVDGSNKFLEVEGSSSSTDLMPSNLWANVGKMELSINQLRLAFQLQKFYEKNARAGTRYREILKEHFGVTSSDARMQVPEYLGGHRFPLSIHQVANQTQTSSDFLGDLGAMSNTADVHEDFVKSFEEHGFVFGVCCVRYDHSYTQGIEKFWCRRAPTDYYFPVFANIGEQPVMLHELYIDNNSLGTNVFGYQEAWADYRYKPNRVSGEMRPGIANSLATWHLSDYYASAPALSDGWIREDLNNVDRVLSVQSSAADQIFADFYVKNMCTRPMPMYSIPGLIDHH